jgi:hypothetical protein
MGYKIWGSITGSSKRFLCIPKNVQMIWGPPTLLYVSNEILFQGYRGQGVRPHFFSVKVKKRELYICFTYNH